MKITCIIVTYNRYVLLQEVVEAVRKQSLKLDEIIVINNNSSDETYTYLQAISKEDSRILTITLKENIGGAGGFYLGVKTAYENGADWIWLLDDDAIPMNNALEALMGSYVFKYYQSIDDVLGFLASRVDWKDGEICNMNIQNVSRDWPSLHNKCNHCVKIVSASFVSVLLNREAIKKVGYPINEFFIWFDDIEYTSRITKSMPAYYIANSIVKHHTKTNMMPADYKYMSHDNLWKYKLGMRNEVAYNCRSGMGWLKGLYFILKKLRLLIINKKGISLIVPMIISGLRGMVFNYPKLIEYPMN